MLEGSAEHGGAALFVLVEGAAGTPRETTQLVSELGEVLQAVRPGWRVKQLVIGEPGAGAAPGEAGQGRAHVDSALALMQRELGELSSEALAAVLVVLVGRLEGAGEQLALVGRGGELLLLREVSATVRGWGGARHVLALAGWSSRASEGEEAALGEACARALAVDEAAQLVAVGLGSHAPRMLIGLRDAVGGAAVDPSTGTVTLASLTAELLRVAPGVVVRGAHDAATLLAPSGLAGAWDPRLSRLAGNLQAMTSTQSASWSVALPPAAHASPPPSATASSAAASSVAPARPAEPEDLTGQVLPGQFRVDALFARGGFGAVYRARQLSVNRDVAVKVLHQAVDPSSPSGRLFVHEIQSVGRIDHPNVVKIHQADITAGGRLFFAMELLEGKTLAQLLEEEGALAPARAVELTRQLLAGLGAAHEEGLVHADVKPANVLVVTTRRGAARAVLVDFGLARLRPAEGAARSLGGTPAFMAPEQLRKGRVDARSDLFSAALVLAYALTGWRRRTADELVPPLAELSASLSEELAATLRRALELEPAKRFQSAAELSEALAAALLGRAPSPQVAAASSEERASPFGPAPLTERDGHRFFGRDRELAALWEHVFYRRVVMVTGRAGAGKTSLVRAGLLPRLAAQGARIVVGQGAAGKAAIEAALGDGASAARLLLVLDEPEPLDALDVLDALAGLVAAVRAHPSAALVLCVDDRQAAALSARDAELAVVRLGPLGREEARASMFGLLVERRLTIEPALLGRVLDELVQHGDGGVLPAQLQRVGLALYHALPAGDATLTLASYERLGGCAAILGEAPPALSPSSSSTAADVVQPRRGNRRALAVGVLVAALGVVVALLVARRIAAGDSSQVIVGGSGTVLFGMLEPLQSFLEEKSGLSVPVRSQFDLGSNGGLRSLRSREIDAAALSARLDRAVPDEIRADGRIMVEVPVGVDETALFVHRDNPLRRIDVNAIRGHLCCGVGQVRPPLSWKQLGAVAPPLAETPVRWVAFGRTSPPVPRDSSSATLLLADEWLCETKQLCASSHRDDESADEIVPRLVTDATVLALSTRSFATAQVVPLIIFDSKNGSRLDGRKVLWLYLALPWREPIPGRLCRFLDAMLDPSVAERLARERKAEALPDALRRLQRLALGLDDGTCSTRPVGERANAEELREGLLRSPIAETVEVHARWVLEPRAPQKP